ncbi:MAG TPA: lipid A deacylase LpxR family protein [Pseudomonas sp.]|nr:lipid A deacylase LpxR family protein [Pseudomonas sp.]
MKAAAFASLVPALLLTGVCHADVLSFKVENDVFSGGRDGHYTNGIEGFRAFEPEAGHWTRNLAGVVPGWTAEDLTFSAYRFGHQMYTPEEIEREELQEDDRPYAGLLFGGVTLFAAQQLDGHRETDTLTVDVGLVGQGAGGKRLQRAVHDVTGSDAPEGWDHQLENELFLNVGYEKRWWQQHSLGGLELEYGPSVGGALGNLYSYLSTGAGVRLGHGLSRSLSQPLVTPSPSGVPYFKPDAGFGWFVFANLEGRYMAHNMLLDGNTFRDSHSVDREPLVGDAQLGLALTWDRWQLSFANVWRSKEFEGQNEHDQFGSLSLSTWL